MRGTLHLIPAGDLPLYTAAMSTRWARPSNAWLKFLGVSEAELKKLVATIAGALNSRPMTREEIISVAGMGQPENVRQWLKSGWGGVLKPVARQGLLCFGPSRAQNVTFVRPREWLGRWRDIDPDTALVEVARRYLRAYGPATKTDFARWWGNWPGVGNAAWSGLATELVAVTVDGVRADLLASDLPKITKAKADRSVVLLPAFDPYLMGHSNRDHLFDRVHRAKVSRHLDAHCRRESAADCGRAVQSSAVSGEVEDSGPRAIAGGPARPRQGRNQNLAARTGHLRCIWRLISGERPTDADACVAGPGDRRVPRVHNAGTPVGIAILLSPPAPWRRRSQPPSANATAVTVR